MIEKVVTKHRLSLFNEIKDHLAYWRTKPPDERVEAVEELRRLHYGDIPRLQRVIQIIRRTSQP